MATYGRSATSCAEFFLTAPPTLVRDLLPISDKSIISRSFRSSISLWLAAIRVAAGSPRNKLKFCFVVLGTTTELVSHLEEMLWCVTLCLLGVAAITALLHLFFAGLSSFSVI